MQFGLSFCERARGPPHRYDTGNATGAVACAAAPAAGGGDGRANVVAGFNLDEPTQAGAFYTVLGVAALACLCAGAVVLQVHTALPPHTPLG
jgi:hypothetical protein